MINFNFIFESEWLRINCMQIFHYLAEELKNTPLFETNQEEEEFTKGAIFNDFDSTPLGLLGTNEEENIQFSQIEPEESDIDMNVNNLVGGEVDRVIIEADDEDGLLHEDLVNIIVFNLNCFFLF